MPADINNDSTGTFNQFSLLPCELRVQIWNWAPRKRVLQAAYTPFAQNPPDAEPRWQICRDSIAPDPVERVCKEARRSFSRFMGVLFHPCTDILLISDPTFTIRAVQRLFFEIEHINRLQHIAFTAPVWQGLRHTHHEFPTAALSPATILRKLEGLTDFTLAVSEDDSAEMETESYGYEGEWSEEFADEWGDVEHAMDEENFGEDDRNHHPLLAQAQSILGDPNSSSERDANGELTYAAKADRFLHGLEERTLANMLEETYSRHIGILRLRPTDHSGSLFFEEQHLFKSDVSMVFDREKALDPDWKWPRIDVREIEEGEMPHDDQFYDWDYESPSDEGSPDRDDPENDWLRPEYESPGGHYTP
ncbi:uncharacterized protein PAC_05554 [Phialocephala subalpina]|uniref:2EXR domain-containing protein n=1 Tax=Phialocephala subalpina TaxID=576137 RepID=A0A1L7WSC5_9HELO|nr:uncharacterized protein PAC_05554 [Phialocephala subalpina]